MNGQEFPWIAPFGLHKLAFVKGLLEPPSAKMEDVMMLLQYGTQKRVTGFVFAIPVRFLIVGGEDAKGLLGGSHFFSASPTHTRQRKHQRF